MKKILIAMICGTMMLSSCYNAGEGAWTGAHVGGMVGGAFGGLVGGHRGYHAGQLVGMATGAATGAAVGATNQAARQERVRGYHRRMKQRIKAEEAARRNTPQRTPVDEVYAPAGRISIGNGISIETNDTIRRYRTATPSYPTPSNGGSYSTPQQDAPVIDETNSGNDIIVFE